MSAVTIADLEAYLGVSLTAVSARAQIILDDLQGEVEGYLGRPVGVQSFTDDYPWTGEEDLLPLRQTPVATVTSVKAVTVATSGETVDTLEVEFYTVTKWGLAGIGSALPSKWPYILRVAYTAGLDLSLPRYKGIRSAILKAAERWYLAAGTSGGALAESDGGAIKSLSTDGGYSVDFAGDGGPLTGGVNGIGSFFPGELTPLKRFKRKG